MGLVGRRVQGVRRGVWGVRCQMYGVRSRWRARSGRGILALRLKCPGQGLYLASTSLQKSCWGTRPRKNSEIHIDVSHSRQPFVKGERLVRYEVNAVTAQSLRAKSKICFCVVTFVSPFCAAKTLCWLSLWVGVTIPSRPFGYDQV